MANLPPLEVSDEVFRKVSYLGGCRQRGLSLARGLERPGQAEFLWYEVVRGRTARRHRP